MIRWTGLGKAGQHIRNFLWEALGFVAIIGAVMVGLALLDGARLVSDQFAGPGATATPTLTITPTPTPTITLTATPEPTATVKLVSEVSKPPSPIEPSHTHSPPETAPEPSGGIVGGNFAALALPPNTRVVYGGCASNGQCYPYNFYWAPTHEAVMHSTSEQGANQETHELCHAHQHWSINGGAPVPPSDYDLGSWYGTAEGQSFQAAVAGLSFPWQLSAVNGIEDFAWTCTNWYRNPERLLQIGGLERYEWAKGNLP